MDNLPVHTSEDMKKFYREQGFKWCYNLPYSPEYNPIELVFSKVKHTFKMLRAKKMTGLIQDGHEAMVVKAVRAVRKQDIVNCIDHVLKLLK